ncbi:MAG: hypothetical protein BRD24_00475, partial [Halobacteriales archaeon SW_9_67_24]
MMQYFVIEQQGWYDELGPDVEVSTFGGGPPLVQAYASGNLDFAYVGISPGVIAVANGVDSRYAYQGATLDGVLDRPM